MSKEPEPLFYIPDEIKDWAENPYHDDGTPRDIPQACVKQKDFKKPKRNIAV